MEQRARGDSKVILLVEDNGIVRDYARLCMEDEGFVVLSAGSAEQALAIFETSAANIDLMVADLNLPAMSGFQLAVHARHQNPDVKILFVSGADSAAVAHSPALLDGNVDFLQKPYTSNALARAIGQLLPPK